MSISKIEDTYIYREKIYIYSVYFIRSNKKKKEIKLHFHKRSINEISIINHKFN